MPLAVSWETDRLDTPVHFAQEPLSIFMTPMNPAPCFTRRGGADILLVGSYVYVFRKPNEAESGGSPLRAGSGRDTIAGPSFILPC